MKSSLYVHVVFIRPSLRRDVLWYTNVRLSVRPSVRFTCRALTYEPLGQFTSNFEFSFQSYGTLFIKLWEIFRMSRCKLRTPCQFTSNFTELLELMVLRSVSFMMKFRIFIPKLWDFIHQIVDDFSYVAL